MNEVNVLPKQTPAVLVVDDSAIIRKMIMTALRPLDPVYREASSGLEALEQIMLRRYDMIMLDLNMPDMHGLEFLRFVRSHKAFQDIPIIVVTTQTDEHTREAVLDAGANAYFTKPFTPQAILEQARLLLPSVSSRRYGTA